MPYLKILVHAVWATKDRQPLMDKSIRMDIFNHIIEYAKTKDIQLDIINGHNEHVHCILKLGSNDNIATIVGLIKGESSHWINKNNLTKTKFEWQDEYFAVSFGESQYQSVKGYIMNQENHHLKKTFTLEYQEFIDKYKFDE